MISGQPNLAGVGGRSREDAEPSLGELFMGHWGHWLLLPQGGVTAFAKSRKGEVIARNSCGNAWQGSYPFLPLVRIMQVGGKEASRGGGQEGHSREATVWQAQCSLWALSVPSPFTWWPFPQVSAQTWTSCHL